MVLNYACSSSKTSVLFYPLLRWLTVLITIQSKKMVWTTPRDRRAQLDRIKNSIGGLDAFYTKKLSKLLPSAAHPPGVSPTMCLVTEYPEHWWKAWKFHVLPHGLWDSIGLKWREDAVMATFVLNDISDLAEEYNVKALDDWYRVLHQVRQKKIPRIRRFNQLGGLEFILHSLFPHHPWNFGKDFPKLVPFFDKPNVGRNYWADATNRQQYLLQLKEQLGGTWASLYKLSPSLLAWTGGSLLLARYKNSIPLMLQSEFPQHKWQSWHFSKRYYKLAILLEKGDEAALNKAKDIIEKIATSLDIRTPEDWVLKEKLLSQSDRYALSQLGGLPIVLQRVYPHHNWADIFKHHIWLPSRSLDGKRKPQNSQHRYAAVEMLMNRRGAEQKPEASLSERLNSLYSITSFELLSAVGRGVQVAYNSSVVSCITTELPYHAWMPWKFETEPRTWWGYMYQALQQSRGSDIVVETSMRLFLEYLIKETHQLKCSIEDWKEWYSTVMSSALLLIQKICIREYLMYKDSTSLITHEQSLPQNVLKGINHSRKRYSSSLPKHYWDHPRNRRMYLEWLVDHYFESSLEHANSKADSKAFRLSGGLGLLNLYRKSHIMALATEFPEHAWKMWRFPQMPKRWWEQVAFLHYTERSPIAETFLREYVEDVFYSADATNLLLHGTSGDMVQRNRIEALGGYRKLSMSLFGQDTFPSTDMFRQLLLRRTVQAIVPHV